jgi:Ion transport protein
LAVENIKILLEADAECANQTLDFNKTPLHLLTDVLDDTNLPTVFEIIQLFSKFGGNFSWPARKSGNQTPFSMLLEKLATLQDKATGSKIIRSLINKYPRIDMFQRKNCAEVIRRNFDGMYEEYQVFANWQEETQEVNYWKSELVKLLAKNEAKFLVMFDMKKNTNEVELKEYFQQGDIIFMSIEQDNFESFVEIYKMNFENVDIEKLDTVVEKVLKLNRVRMLKHILNHGISINPVWMIYILWQMEDEESNTNPAALRCFHILLNHTKYEVNAQIPEVRNITALHLAAMKSKYATLELLKRGASLEIPNEAGHKPIQFIDNNTLKKYFDSCVTRCTPDDRTDFSFLVFDYPFLNAPNKMSPKPLEEKTMPLLEFITTKKEIQSLIEHPVITSFLYLRWWKLSNIFYLNMLLFSWIAAIFSIYLFFFYANPDYQDSTNTGWFQFSYGSAITAFGLFSAREFIQFLGSPSGYLKSVTNYLELIVICLMATTLFGRFEDPQIRCPIAATLFLGFAIEWTFLLSVLPVFTVSNYIVMLKKVAGNFLRMLAFYLVILVAFTLSFYTLINKPAGSPRNSTTIESNVTTEKPKNSNMFSAFFHVILMLTGDFGNVTEDLADIITGRILLIAFVLSMTIVLMNLLIGLTVTDTAAIEREAQRYEWSERVKLMGKYECMAWNW